MIGEKKFEGSNHMVALAVIFFISFGIYFNSLQGDFIWDDKDLILEHTDYLGDWRNLFSVFTEPFFGKAAIYRPLLIISFIIDYQLWGSNSFGFHYTNVLLHTVNAFMVYLLAFFLFKHRAFSLFSGLLFATHPIQTEAVAWISGRNDVIMTFFSLLTILFYIRWQKLTGVKRVVTFISFLIGYGCILLSKESGIIVLLLIIMVDYFFKLTPRDWEAKRKAYLSVLLVSFLFIYIRMNILGGLGVPISPMQGGFAHLLLGAFTTYAYYFKIFFFPIHQTANPFIPSLYFLKDPLVISSLFFIIVLMLITVTCWRRFREVSFIIIWIFVTLLPVSGFFLLTIPALEHRLYLGSVGFSIMMPLLLYRLSYAKINYGFFKNGKAVIFLLLICIIITYSSKTVVRNNVWKDESYFWLKTVQDTPISVIAHNNLGLVYFNEGHYDQAFEEFEQALSLNPYAANVYANLGVLYVAQGLYQKAISVYEKAVMLKPKKAKFYNNLGNLYYRMLKESNPSTQAHSKGVIIGLLTVDEVQKLYQMSFNNYKKALQLNTNDAEIHNNLGDLYYLEQSYQSALEEYTHAVKLNPYYAEAYNNLGLVYLKENNHADAQKAFSKAMELDPGLAEAYNNLGLSYFYKGFYHKALEKFNRAVTLMPHSAEVYFNMALVYLRGFNDKRRGIYYLKESLRIDPLQSRATMIKEVLVKLGSDGAEEK